MKTTNTAIRIEDYNGAACPFCLSLDIRVRFDTSGKAMLYFCECGNCYARGPAKVTALKAVKAFIPHNNYTKK